MIGNIFLVSAVVNPTDKEYEEKGTLSTIVLEPKHIVATDEKQAAIKVIMDCAVLDDIDKDRLEVIVRPF